MHSPSSARLLFLLSVPLGLAASAGGGGAEPATATGRVAGVVRTADGAVLPHVKVTLRGPGEPVIVTTGPEGAFRAGGLGAGDYTATVDTPGLEPHGDARVRVTAGAEAPLDVVLVAAPVRERVVVSATRGEATLSTLGVATDVLDRERVDERAAPSLLTLLEEVPGVAVARTGGTGLQASAFIRGGESRYARVLVDGVAVNQPGGAYDFGTALPFELERVEVVRGAASSLYGSDALAGVVSLETRRARIGETPSLRAEGEGGGSAWRRFSGASSGARGAFDWSAGAQRLATDNQQPNSAFDETSAALSAGVRFDAATDARLVVRFDDGTVVLARLHIRDQNQPPGGPEDTRLRRNDLFVGGEHGEPGLQLIRQTGEPGRRHLLEADLQKKLSHDRPPSLSPDRATDPRRAKPPPRRPVCESAGASTPAGSPRYRRARPAR